MLSYLAIKNVSVIESVSFELKKGLTVLTGETGSGKSVLVGALKLLLGDRFQKNMLREGTDKLLVEGVFNNVSHIPQELKEQFEVEDELIIRREADESGKNRVFINNRLATVSQLKDFAPYLADIHGQHEHQALLDESRHIAFVDHLVPAAVKDGYSEAYNNYRKDKTLLDKLLAELDEMKKHQDMLLFQFNEINSANIDLKNDLELEEKINFVSHIEKVREVCASSIESLSDGQNNAVESLSRSLKGISALSEVVQELKPAEESLSSALDLINDAVKTLNLLNDRQEVSADDLDSLLSRKFTLQDLMRKYGGSLESVLQKRDEISQKLSNFENSDGLVKKLADNVNESLKSAEKAAAELLSARKTAANQIGKQVVAILHDLDLPHSRFEAIFDTKDSLDSRGGVDSRFYISLNAGFEPAPLARVASGGEISRVMLALKEVFSESDPISTLLFDEIDVGISGRTAKKVADKLVRLSDKKQVIVITHLPVVAAQGASHFHITKNVSGNMTKTTINELKKTDRVKVIASMIAGETTDSALRQAEELMNHD